MCAEFAQPRNPDGVAKRCVAYIPDNGDRWSSDACWGMRHSQAVLRQREQADLFPDELCSVVVLAHHAPVRVQVKASKTSESFLSLLGEIRQKQDVFAEFT